MHQLLLLILDMKVRTDGLRVSPTKLRRELLQIFSYLGVEVAELAVSILFFLLFSFERSKAYFLFPLALPFSFLILIEFKSFTLKTKVLV